ncbi:MAG: hypothetical protein R2734_03820 [Nocardioides sp.]
MSSPNARRRQRSVRLTAAVALLLVAAAAVAGAVTIGSTLLVSVAAVSAVVLGSIATRITHSELMAARRDAARDRAEQAQAYASLTERRTSENVAFATGLGRRLTRQETALGQLEEALCSAQKRAADATRQLADTRGALAKAESDNIAYARRLEEAEERAAEAIVVAELEQERDVLRAEVGAWEAMGDQAYRRHA